LLRKHNNKRKSIIMGSSFNGDPNLKDSYGKTELIIASHYGYKDIVKLLLDKGADPNIQDNNGQTALMYASSFGHKDIVELLLDRDADTNLKDNNGYTAMTCAIKYDRPEIVELIKGHIALQHALQHALQNLAMTKSMISLPSPLEYLDYDIMKEIMICNRAYNHSVHMRMKG